MGAYYSKADYDQLQNSQEDSEEEYEGFEIIRPVVVTGFGRVNPKGDKNDEKNFSWRVVKKLSETITDNQGKAVPVIRGQHGPKPVDVCYSHVKDPSFQDWLISTDALVYLHLGIAERARNHIYLETTARRDIDFVADKYEHVIPDDTPKKSGCLYPSLDNDCEPLQTSFQLPVLCAKLTERFKSGIRLKTCSAKPISDLSFKVWHDAGNFLCDFLYYESLNLATKRKSVNPDFPRSVLLIHIPAILCLPEEDEFSCIERSEKCASEKAEALVEVIEFIVKELLEQVYAADKDRAATMKQ